ncbi:MAG: LysR family transcriptional regulator [Dinoroseobacter sp.]|nr:LysR family transcriptional regulator [Dinoroseobacter sp.]
MAFTLRQLRFAVAVADNGSVTKAAKALGISQPGISLAIRELEAEFGLSIFLRHPARNVTLTQSGRDFISQARALLNKCDSFEANVLGLGYEMRGTVSVGCFTLTSPFVMPYILKEISEKYTDITINFAEESLDELNKQLKSGVLDIALMYDMQQDHQIEFEPLFHVNPYALLPEDDPLSKQEKVSLFDLAEREMITLDLPVTEFFFRSLFEEYDLNPKQGQRIKSYELLRNLVGLGQGFSVLLMKPPADTTYTGKRVVARPIKEEMPKVNYGVSMLRSSRQTQAVKAVVQVCRDVLANESDLVRGFRA